MVCALLVKEEFVFHGVEVAAGQHVQRRYRGVGGALNAAVSFVTWFSYLCEEGGQTVPSRARAALARERTPNLDSQYPVKCKRDTGHRSQNIIQPCELPTANTDSRKALCVRYLQISGGGVEFEVEQRQECHPPRFDGPVLPKGRNGPFGRSGVKALDFAYVAQTVEEVEFKQVRRKLGKVHAAPVPRQVLQVGSAAERMHGVAQLVEQGLRGHGVDVCGVQHGGNIGAVVGGGEATDDARGRHLTD
ncbi:uncharacterized protein BcabD6B2_12940 [Babesia caballi]|uniref:Uncharacterized protein n=1 Tax=Babesia caballi TaxID=5871 RepID=A0AAV4LT81_BABCB|nr:hypothetical protein BcabD6B2_12940 [Babesia caballi]